METKHIVLIDTSGMTEEESIKYILDNAIHLNFGKLGIITIDKNSAKAKEFIENAIRYAKLIGDKEEVKNLNNIISRYS